jgi:hypothetical protein
LPRLGPLRSIYHAMPSKEGDWKRRVRWYINEWYACSLLSPELAYPSWFIGHTR